MTEFLKNVKRNVNQVEISASIMCIDWLNAGSQLKILEEENIVIRK